MDIVDKYNIAVKALRALAEINNGQKRAEASLLLDMAFRTANGDDESTVMAFYAKDALTTIGELVE